MSTVAAGSMQGGEGEAKRPKLFHLPEPLMLGIVFKHFEADVDTKQATSTDALQVPVGCSFAQLVLICNTMVSLMDNKESPVSTANTFLHGPFQEFITKQLKNFIPDLGVLHNLRNHSMKYILEKCIEDSANPQKVIAELLARLFGVMCLLWDLLLKEKGWMAHINAQAAGVEMMQPKINEMHAKMAKEQRKMRKNLERSKTICDSMRLLKQTDKAPEMAAKNALEMDKLKETMVTLSNNFALMVKGRQEEKICAAPGLTAPQI